MTFSELVYTAGLSAARVLAPIATWGDGKVATSVRGALGAADTLKRWAAEGRDPARGLVWFHAPSVGEGLQAKAVIEELRAARPDIQIVYTYFSASAEPFSRSVPAHFVGYLPPDLPGTMAGVLDSLRPTAIAFSKTEVWPNLTRLATRRGIPCALLSATLPANSSRLGWLARSLLSVAHQRLSTVGAISADDARRYARLGVTPNQLRVMGDARFDQVWRRSANPEDTRAVMHGLTPSGSCALVAGSTWPADEDQLLPAFAEVENSDLRLILAPHEPTGATLGRIERSLDGLSLTHARLGDEEQARASSRVLLVDRVGILGDLYALADIAFVGGGFGTSGLHSVLEPAAFGKPVIFGPNHENSREAGELIGCGGGRAVVDGQGIAHWLRCWLGDESERLEAGTAARCYVESGIGAAERGARIVLGLLQER